MLFVVHCCVEQGFCNRSAAERTFAEHIPSQRLCCRRRGCPQGTVLLFVLLLRLDVCEKGQVKHFDLERLDKLREDGESDVVAHMPLATLTLRDHRTLQLDVSADDRAATTICPLDVATLHKCTDVPDLNKTDDPSTKSRSLSVGRHKLREQRSCLPHKDWVLLLGDMEPIPSWAEQPPAAVLDNFQALHRQPQAGSTHGAGHLEYFSITMTVALGSRPENQTT
jgi:hypothetical protein